MEAQHHFCIVLYTWLRDSRACLTLIICGHRLLPPHMNYVPPQIQVLLLSP